MSQKRYSSALRIGKLLRQQLEQDPHFYLFSPDETTSNHLDAVFDVTERAWDLPRRAWDLPEATEGRIVEMLSENVLFSTMTGHLLNGEQAMMTSYEAFLPIITSQLLQQVKFLKQANTVNWRPKYPAVNLLSTSTCWRQDHNGFTHQSPALISMLLELPSGLSNCYFPVDDNSAATIFTKMLESRNVVNLTTFNKTEEPRWLTEKQASEQLETGAITLEKVSDQDPEIIFTAAGDIMTREAIAAMEILRQDLPKLKLRFVSIAALSYQAIGTTNKPLSKVQFQKHFGSEQPIIANFHGYPEALHSILAHYTTPDHISVHGYQDHGSTTTPFEMLALNETSRYHLCIDAVKRLKKPQLVQKYQKIIAENHQHALDFGVDKIEI